MPVTSGNTRNMHGISSILPQPKLTGESFSLCFQRMMKVFSFVHTHMLAADEPLVPLILLFSQGIG